MKKKNSITEQSPSKRANKVASKVNQAGRKSGQHRGPVTIGMDLSVWTWGIRAAATAAERSGPSGAGAQRREQQEGHDAGTHSPWPSRLLEAATVGNKFPPLVTLTS